MKNKAINLSLYMKGMFEVFSSAKNTVRVDGLGLQGAVEASSRFTTGNDNSGPLKATKVIEEELKDLVRQRAQRTC